MKLRVYLQSVRVFYVLRQVVLIKFQVEEVFLVSFERIDIIHFSNISFYYNRFSSSDPNQCAMGRFRIHLLIPHRHWSPKKAFDEKTKYGANSTDWSLINLVFMEAKYWIRRVYDQIETTHADMGFCKITITYSVC